MRVKGLECATFSTYQGTRESERKGRKEVVERKENRYRVFFFSFYTGEGQIGYPHQKNLYIVNLTRPTQDGRNPTCI
jgi:hypothetical protein